MTTLKAQRAAAVMEDTMLLQATTEHSKVHVLLRLCRHLKMGRINLEGGNSLSDCVMEGDTPEDVTAWNRRRPYLLNL
jgi:hypothetical protein